MSITWKELQETCLRKMDSLDGAALAKDSNNAAYLYGMPAAANEALMLLATNGRYWKKLLTITQGEGETATKGEPLGGFLAYDLRQLAEGFYCIDKIKRASGTDYGTYSGYMMEGDHVLLLPAEDEGTFRVWYNAYPTRITAETAADFPIDLHEEAAHYVAHYMAGQLFKHDDISIAQIYMNEFFEWMERLAESGRKADGRNAGSGGWTSVKNYY